MQSSNRLFDDLAKVAGGAASAIAGVREEIEGLVRQRVERLLADLDLVGRDELDVAKAMAAKARAGQEKLEARVSALEAALSDMETPRARKKSAVKDAGRDEGEPAGTTEPTAAAPGDGAPGDGAPS